MFGIGQWEILVIFLVVLLFFGAKRLPEMAQGLGKGIREFRKAVRDVQDEIDVAKPSAPPSADASGEAATPSAQRAMPPTASDPAQEGQEQQQHPETTQKS